MKIREVLDRLPYGVWLAGFLLWIVFSMLLWPLGFLFWFWSFGPGVHLRGAGLGPWNWLVLLAVFAVAYGPLGLTFVSSKAKDRRTARERVEQQKIERKAAAEEYALRKQTEAQAQAELERTKLMEAKAYREKMERFHMARPDLEPFLVGDDRTGIRSPYEVEMTAAEIALLDTIASRFDPACLLVDTYLDRGDGQTTQIDIIAICRQGIIVIESKGRGGTIRGKADATEWIHEPSGQRIYNPIRQNDLHVESVYRVLDPTEAQLDRAAETEDFGCLRDALYRHAHEQLKGRSLLFADRKDSNRPLLLVFDEGVRPRFFRIEIPGHDRFLDFSREHAVAYGLVAFSDDDRLPDFKFLPEWVYSLVVFNEGAEFPDLRLHSSTCQVAGAHRASEAIDRILSRDEVLSDAEVMKMAYKIKQHRVIPDRDVREAHIRDIQVATGRYGVLE